MAETVDGAESIVATPQSEAAEPAAFDDTTVSFPVGLYQITNLRDVLTMDVWNRLEENEKQSLLKFLPPLSGKTLESTLTSLFAGEQFYFGNPIDLFHARLKEGLYHPRAVKLLRALRQAEQKRYLEDQKVYRETLVTNLLHYKRQMGFPGLQQEVAHAVELGARIDISKFEEDNTKRVTRKKRKPSEPEAPIAEQPVPISSATETTERAPEPPAPNPMLRISSYMPRKRKRQEMETQRKTLQLPSFKVFGFFAAIRNAFHHPSIAEAHYTATIDQLITQTDLSSCFAEEVIPSYTPREFVNMALHLLAYPPPPPASNAADRAIDPFVHHDKPTKRWTWIQSDVPLSESTPPAISTSPLSSTIAISPLPSQSPAPASTTPRDKQLESLEQLFFFAVSRHHTTPKRHRVILSALRQLKSLPTIPSTPPDELARFREQEADRYRVPDRPYTYVFRGVRCPVGPLRRIGDASAKARDHVLLRPDRPASVTILGLVRDAAARLPGGIGTRIDVCVLLRDSQYVVDGAPEHSLNMVVSGALDRLHADPADPCVRYDGDRKLWVYLHRRRSEVDFEKYAAALAAAIAAAAAAGPPQSAVNTATDNAAATEPVATETKPQRKPARKKAKPTPMTTAIAPIATAAGSLNVGEAGVALRGGVSADSLKLPGATALAAPRGLPPLAKAAAVTTPQPTHSLSLLLNPQTVAPMPPVPPLLPALRSTVVRGPAVTTTPAVTRIATTTTAVAAAPRTTIAATTTTTPTLPATIPATKTPTTTPNASPPPPTHPLSSILNL